MKLKNLVSLILASAFVLVAASRADAALQIALETASMNGGARTVVATGPDFGTATFNAIYGNFTVLGAFTSSSNGATLSDLLSSAVRIINNGAATDTIRVWVTQTSYSLPVGTPLAVEAALGGSVNSGALSLTNIFQVWGDNANAAFGVGQTPGPKSATFNGTSFDTGSLTGLFNRTSANSLYSVTSVANLTISGLNPQGVGGQVNFGSHVNLTAVPEPVSLVMLGTGLVGLAGSAKRRALKRARQ